MSKKLLTEEEQDEFLKNFFKNDDTEEEKPKILEIKKPKPKIVSEFTIETKEFIIKKENEKNKFLIRIEKTKSNIVIQCLSFELRYGNDEPEKATHSDFVLMEQMYRFLINIFEKDDAIIKEIKDEREMKIQLTDTSGRKKKEYIVLKYK